ncbi:hypothetical protein SLS62_010714 [Diatrype stigma]|uniref:AAA+ ATPase domain-containing protein n=1 Tax=Diatrype stigma TaxID=117547 RepID=A0AAN9U8A7_9PEZI
MTTHNEDDGVSPEINSNENVDGDANENVPVDNIEAEIGDALPDPQSSAEDTDPVASSNEHSSLPEYNDASQQPECPVPHADEIPPDDQHSPDISSTEHSSHEEHSTSGESTEGSTTSSSNSSECDHETPEDKDSHVDPDTSPTDSASDTSQPSDQESACEEFGDSSQDMPFPDTITHVYGLDEAFNYSWAESLVRDQDPKNIDDESPSRKEWLRQKREEGQENKYLDQIMSMVGHEDVKAHFLHVKNRLEVAKRWGEDISRLKFDLILHGNAGTGKKRIAQIYAQFLYSTGAVSMRKFTSMSGYTLESDDPDASDDLDASVYFFSQADRIDRAHEIKAILREANNRYSRAALIFSYQKLGPSSASALRGSPEARKRFPEPIKLNDYNEHEFLQLLIRLLKQSPWRVEGGIHAGNAGLRAIAKRAFRKNEERAFGKNEESSQNIHILQEELEVVYNRQSLRCEKEWYEWAKTHRPEQDAMEKFIAERQKGEHRIITPSDIFGPAPKDIQTKSKAWTAIQKMIGLERVKREIGHLYAQATTNYHRMTQGKEPLKVNLNRVFLGPPGVGKTTVAYLYGQILAELNLISKGKVIMKNPADLIDMYIGKSEKNTKEALEEAKGNVLVIDDAHMLYTRNGSGSNNSDIFRRAIIDTLVAEISGAPGEDRCIILAGYPEEMETMFQGCNPGLQRRFPRENALHFDSYDEDQLCDILLEKLASDDVSVSERGKKVAREVLARMRVSPKFGNGGDVENLIARAKLRQRERLEAAGVDRFAMDELPLEPEDFDKDYDRAVRANEHRNSLFEGFVGFESIVQQFRGYQQMADGMRRYDIDPRPHIPWAFVFKGPPGTGKTSTARKVGRLFYDMGFLSSDEVITCSVTDLIGQYCGQTGPKVINQFELGLGKVLFIDEAYRLNPGSDSSIFTKEAIGEIVDAMTKPRYVGNMVVILAGYTSDMEKLLDSNQGLRSRFATHINFPHMEPHHCFSHLTQQLGKLNIKVGNSREVPGTRQMILETFKKLTMSKGWANGRDIETLARSIIGHAFMNAGQVGGDPGEDKELCVSSQDILPFLQTMLKERQDA